MGVPPTPRSWRAVKATRGTALGGVEGPFPWNWLGGRRVGEVWISWLPASGFASRVDPFVEFRVAGQVQKRCHAALHRTPRRRRAEGSPRDVEPAQTSASSRPGATFGQLKSPKSMAMGRNSPLAASAKANDASTCVRHPEPAGKIDGWPGSKAVGSRAGRHKAQEASAQRQWPTGCSVWHFTSRAGPGWRKRPASTGSAGLNGFMNWRCPLDGDVGRQIRLEQLDVTGSLVKMRRRLK